MRGIAVISGSQLPHIRKHIGKPVIVADNGDLILTNEHDHTVQVFRNGAADYVPLLTPEGLDKARAYWATMEAITYGDAAHDHTMDALNQEAQEHAGDLLDDLLGGWPSQTHDEHMEEITQCAAIRDYRAALSH